MLVNNASFHSPSVRFFLLQHIEQAGTPAGIELFLLNKEQEVPL